ncbi:sideroflexin-5-like isoform X1 [Paramuricea clavata]|uniref:Sidoreflexin n=1 Tax=Paramuricea clavata TaxID=317549 RepID=A0A6S7H005_PARCT|nr:sideroflexin-5-like isoform X1 [Paramuricea clavata]
MSDEVNINSNERTLDTVEFSLRQPKYDQNTFWGRYRRCLDIIDPRTLLVSKEKEQDCLKLLDAYKHNKLPPDVTSDQLWEARKIKEAIFHPDTNEKIFMPFRMAGFVPFGTITVVGMLLPAPTLSTVVFWQWLNQSHNAAVNYSNRNATKPTPTSRFILSYVTAITSAVSIAVGLTVFVQKAKIFSPQVRRSLQRLIAFPATASANICNVLAMRSNELIEGVELVDSEGNVKGTSKIAAKRAIFETIITRVFLSGTVLCTPAFVMTALERTKFLRRNPRFTLPIQAIVCVLSFGIALPFAIALFPQMSQIDVKDTEPEIQNNCNELILHYNKGL